MNSHDVEIVRDNNAISIHNNQMWFTRRGVRWTTFLSYGNRRSFTVICSVSNSNVLLHFHLSAMPILRASGKIFWSQYSHDYHVNKYYDC